MDTDDEILGRILRRWLTDGQYRYWFFNRGHLTLDSSIGLDEDEYAVLLRTTGGKTSPHL